jgi:HipA-like protein
MSVVAKIKTWLGKAGRKPVLQPSVEDSGTFFLMVDGIKMGILTFHEGVWEFQYAEEFKAHTDKYHSIVGFPSLERIYRSATLWPFFQIRIPGLKQPLVQELLKKESISPDNQFALLKRFGRKSISNPYELVFSA